jgi:glyoxylase-like metal-dependent hydrolase (beta-lactamase superfamily II)
MLVFFAAKEARMRKLVAAAAIASTLGFLAVHAQVSKATLEAAAKALGATTLTSLQFSASGAEYAFGQAYHPGQPWPAFTVTNFAASINYATPAMRVDVDRTNPGGAGPVRGGGGLPLVAPMHQIRIVSGQYAWGAFNANPGPNGQVPPLVPAQAAVQERLLQIWTTPQGVIKAAQNGNATVNGRAITFSVAGATVVATLNSDSLVQKVEWKTDMPMLGDTANETTYSNYRDFGGVKFPMRIAQKQGGFPILELVVTEVVPNANVAITVPPNIQQAGAAVPAPKVDTTKLADGVFWLAGGTHHSVAVEFKDYSVLVDTPVADERAMAVIDATKQAIPGKPIKYVVNTHHHFDHTGGLRAAVAQGIPIIVHDSLRSYYEKVFALPHTIMPDLLARSPKKPVFETVSDKRVMTDGARELDLMFCKTTHADSLLVGYLPKEKILIEADLFNPPPANTPAPPVVNPANAELLDFIQRMKLDVDQIAPTHQRLATMNDLRKMTTKASTN